jgi:hypothetical protein
MKYWREILTTVVLFLLPGMGQVLHGSKDSFRKDK